MTPFGQPKFESWIDRQIREATERGELDNLAGAGQPIKNLNSRDENWWINAKLESEDLRAALPTTLSLRREAAEIGTVVASLRTEDQVRETVTDLNARIVDARRRQVDGPQIFIHTVDVERVVREWREARA